MAQVIWSPSALEDVDEIARYIARDSKDRAALLVSRLVEAAEKLADFPNAGRVIPEMGEPTSREVFVGPYRVMYRVMGDEIWVTGIVHGARDWKPPS